MDIGANNGFNALQMLRGGASEVIGVEIDKIQIEYGKLLKDAYEWVDGISYNFSYIQSDMKEIPQINNFGQFDIVTAFCCIYYLHDNDIYSLIKYLSTITSTLILQCNINTHLEREKESTFRKSSIEYNMELLKGNGFRNIKVIAPRKYQRPLIIGYK